MLQLFARSNQAADSLLTQPSVQDEITFRCKASLFQLRRSVVNCLQPVRRYKVSQTLTTAELLAESVTPLWTSHEVNERNLIAGKIHNLRIAARKIDGIELPAHAIFSFWAQVGYPSRYKGYVNGRELRQGCVVPSIGGGLCQLSNALYSAALDAGLEIVERHAHTKIMPGSLAEVGRDATVFWNYVDLRFRSVMPLRIEVQLTAESLIVRFKGESAVHSSPTQLDQPRPVIQQPKSCQTCGITSCFRSSKQPGQSSPQYLSTDSLFPTAYLLDEYWPEFDQYIQQHRRETDLLAIPLDGQRWRKQNYAWNLAGFQQVKQSGWLTLERSFACRRLPAQGSSRQQLLLEFDRKLAHAYSAQLTYDKLHCVVAQNLLPFLWQLGALAGRSFDVLMTRLPLFALQERLDWAAQQHPDSPTLSDFRSDPDLVAAERQALQTARQIITPHAEIASLYPQTVLLDWQIPQPASPTPGKAILFAATTLGRKGAYEIRQAAANLNLTLRILGQPLEATNFWDGIATEPVQPNPLDGVGLVVLPAYVEHRPRLLLKAIASGIPVIASTACGLANLPAVTTIPTGDLTALENAIAEKRQSIG